MLSETVTRFVGEKTVRTFDVEKGAIQRYADAVGDSNPIYWDEDLACSSGYGGIVAPAGFFGWPSRWTSGGVLISELVLDLRKALEYTGYARVIDGSLDQEFHLPVFAGDVLAVTSTITDIREKEAGSGRMVFVVMETTYVNQIGRLVARETWTSIVR